jgi:hypothetical protein
MITNENGGRSSCTHIATFPVRRMPLPFTVVAPVVKTIVPSSSTSYQTGAACGRPSRRVVASTPGRTCVRRNARHSASSMRA